LADEALAVLDPETEQAEELAPVEELETVDESVDAETEESEGSETERDFDAELQSAREEAAKEARETALREAEEERSKSSYQQARTHAAQVRQQTGLKAATDLVAWSANLVEQGRTPDEVLRMVNQRVTQSLVEPLEAMVATEQWENLWGFYQSRFDKEWKPPQDVVNKLRSAEATRDPARMFDAAFAYMEQYVADTRAPKLAEERVKAEREKDKKASEVARTKAGDSARKNAERPTAIGGGNGAVNSKAAAQATLENPEASLAQKQKAYEVLNGRKFGS